MCGVQCKDLFSFPSGRASASSNTSSHVSGTCRFWASRRSGRYGGHLGRGVYGQRPLMFLPGVAFVARPDAVLCLVLEVFRGYMFVEWNERFARLSR